MNRNRLASALIAVVAALAASATASAEEPELRTIRVCDVSACYVAWNVVDSDGDGISDADEVAAGSDPFDAESRLPLPVIVEMIGAQALPTFEFGVGRITVKPAELQAELEARVGGGESPLAAFPLGERKDAMSRLGLDSELLAEHGYDAEFDGLTLVMQRDDQDMPIRRVGGVDVRLISAEDPEEVQINDVIEIYNYEDGSTGYLLDNGDFLYEGLDGGLRQNKDGVIIDEWYVNPDADTGPTEPTEEDIKAWKRLRGATVRTVADWSGVEVDPETLRDPNETIILIDPDHAGYEAEFTDPRQIDTAQPESRPELPNPLQEGGGCLPKCGR